MKRFAAILTLFALIFLLPAGAFGFSEGAPNQNNINIEILTEESFEPTNPPYVTAEGSVLIEQETGKVLFDKDAHKKLFPASTTKLLTALIAIEKGNLDDIVTVGDEVWMIPADSSKACIVTDEQITLRDLLFGLMVNSGNDAAMTIAVHIARSIKGNELSTQEALDYFAELMNQRAKEAGALNSNFVNPHGYHDTNHYTTAYDLAMITRDAMKYEFFHEITSTINMETKYWDTKEPRYWHNKNRLINKYYPEYYEYATGGKTGWTTPAGPCLVSTAAKDGMNLISVVLKSEYSKQWSDTVALFNYGFHNFKPVELFSKGNIFSTLETTNHASGDSGQLSIEISTEGYTGVFHKSDLSKIKQSITWNNELLDKDYNQAEDLGSNLPVLTAPVYKGQIVGEVVYSLEDEVIARCYLTAARDIPKKEFIPKGTNSLSKKEASNYGKYVLMVLGALVIIKAVFSISKHYKRRHSGYLFRR